MKKATALFSLAVCVFSGWVIWLTYSLKRSLISHDIGPAVYPRLLCYVLIALAVMLVISEFFGKKPDEKIRFLSLSNLIHIAMFLVFLLAFETLGFPVCAFFMMCIIMKIMGCPKWWEIVLFSLAATAIVYLVFKKILLVRLPLGVLEAVFK